MDEKLQSRADQLEEEFADSATTIDKVNQLMRLMMKSSLEKMLNRLQSIVKRVNCGHRW